LESLAIGIDAALAEAAASGVFRIVGIGMGRDSSLRTISLAEDHDQIWAAIGVHPNSAAEWRDDDVGWLTELAAHPKVVAIGECGMDFYRDTATPGQQERAFRAQIAVARATGLPLVIHTRDADDATLGILRSDAAGLEIILHCFSLVDHVDEVIDAGWYASFAGPLTFKTNDALREAAAHLPDDRILVETDSPYLAPVPRRGKPNQPAYVAHTLAVLAEVRGIDITTCDELTTANATRVFGW
jgi:TatD DNase family protein